MSASDSGSWRLLIYPIAIIFVISFVMNMTIQPFIDSGVSAPSNVSIFETAMINTANYGIPVNATIDLGLFSVELGMIANPFYHYLAPQSFKDFLAEQVVMFSYLPNVVKYPILAIILISIVYALYVLATMLIP